MADPLPPPYVPASLDFADDSRGRDVAAPRATGAPTATGLAPGKSGKLYRLGIKRDQDVMYFIKGGDVWGMPRNQPGKPRGKAFKVASIGFEMDYAKYLYYLDGDGDIAVKPRQIGGR